MSHFRGPEVGNNTQVPHASFLQLVIDKIEYNGDSNALIDGDSGETASYRDVLEQSKSIAAGLSSRGVGEDDVVVLCCDQGVLSYTVLLGVMFTGATVALAPTPNADIIHKLVKGVKVKAVFCEPQYLETVQSSLQNMEHQPKLVTSVDRKDPLVKDLLNSSTPFQLYQVKNSQQHCSLVLFSSGTTGDPKGIPMNDWVLYKSCSRQISMKSYLSLSPMYWLSGLIFNLNFLVNKVTVVMSNNIGAENILKLTDKHQIETWYLSVRSVAQLVNITRRELYDLSSLKIVMAGGEPVLDYVGQQFIKTFIGPKVRFFVMYGTTEAGGLAMNGDLKLVDLKNKLISCGKVVPGAEIKVTDEERNVLPLGHEGDIWIKSDSLTTGYWNKPELNEKLFDHDGFMQTGDLGYFDNQGNLYTLGRIVDLITYKGKRFAPSLAENILISHLEVQEAVVVGKPNPEAGQLPTAYVVRNPGSLLTEEELQSLVDGQVEDHSKLRGGVHFRDSLPRLVIGKVIRKKLRQ